MRLGTDFRKLFGSSVASNLGDGLLMAADPLLAYSLTRDPLLVGPASFFKSLPWFLASLLSGAIVDRLDGKRVMGFANCARAALAAIGVAVLLEAAPLPTLYAALFVVGLSETFFDNASQTILPAVVGDDLACTAALGSPSNAFVANGTVQATNSNLFGNTVWVRTRLSDGTEVDLSFHLVVNC